MFLMLPLLSVATAQEQPQKQAYIAAYFKDRLAKMDEETHLIPAALKQSVKINGLAEQKQAIWALWSTAVKLQDALPTVTTVEADKKDYPVDSWELKKEDPLPFYYIKKGSDQAKKHALFLNLHGSGPKDPEFKNTLAWSLRYADAPSYYFIPQIPNVQRYRWWFKPVQYAWERLFRLAMLDEAIDANKIFVMGISEGGYGSQRLGAFYADYLAGAGPMAGGEPLKNAPPLNFRNIAFSLQTGENDGGFGRNKLTLAAKEAFGKLALENPDAFKNQIILQPNKGHGIDYTTTTPWLVNYSRNPHPKHVSWVLFPMDGRYRKGFYNVALDAELPVKEEDTFDRILFDIQYSDNNEIQVRTALMDKEMLQQKELPQLAFSLFLDDNYVNLKKKVKVYLNGKLVYHKKLALNEANMVESCALFGDPNRVFPAKISIR